MAKRLAQFSQLDGGLGFHESDLTTLLTCPISSRTDHTHGAHKEERPDRMIGPAENVVVVCGGKGEGREGGQKAVGQS